MPQRQKEHTAARYSVAQSALFLKASFVTFPCKGRIYNGECQGAGENRKAVYPHSHSTATMPTAPFSGLSEKRGQIGMACVKVALSRQNGKAPDLP